MSWAARNERAFRLLFPSGWTPEQVRQWAKWLPFGGAHRDSGEEEPADLDRDVIALLEAG
jgi:hypothetical protein